MLTVTFFWQAVSKHVYRAFRGKDPESIDN